MSISLLSNLGLFQPLSSSSSASSASGLKTLSSFQKPLEKQIAANSSSPQLAEDTYTSSGQTQVVQSSSTSSNAWSSSGTLADLIKNQTISGSADARQAVFAAIDSSEKRYIGVKAAWDDIVVDVAAGDYSGAQTALTDYTTTLTSLHYDTSLIQNPVDALGSALKSGNQADVQTAFKSFTSYTPEVILGVENLQFTGDSKLYAAQAEQVAPALADELQKMGYTADNAAVEANAILLGIMIDRQTLTVNGAATSNLSEVDQSIANLAKDMADSTGSNQMTNIIAALAQANSVTAMESTLTQLDGKYGTAAQGTAADNVSQASVSAYT